MTHGGPGHGRAGDGALGSGAVFSGEAVLGHALPGHARPGQARPGQALLRRARTGQVTHAQRVLIGPAVHGRTADPSGTGAGGADEPPGDRQAAGRTHHPGQRRSPIDVVGSAWTPVEQHVGRLDVAVHESGRVCRSSADATGDKIPAGAPGSLLSRRSKCPRRHQVRTASRCTGRREFPGS